MKFLILLLVYCTSVSVADFQNGNIQVGIRVKEPSPITGYMYVGQDDARFTQRFIDVASNAKAVWVYDFQYGSIKISSGQEDELCLSVPEIVLQTKKNTTTFTLEKVVVDKCIFEGQDPKEYEDHRGNLHSGQKGGAVKLKVSRESQNFAFIYQKCNCGSVVLKHLASGLCLRMGIPDESFNYNYLVDCADDILSENVAFELEKNCANDSHYSCNSINETKNMCPKDEAGVYHIQPSVEMKECTACQELVATPQKIKNQVQFACSACPIGTATHKDDMKCIPCASGYYTHEAGMMECTKCSTLCPPGSKLPVTKDCNSTTDITCTDCEDGTFMHERSNKDECIKCKETCDIGQGFVSSCNKTNDLHCKQCVSGKNFKDKTDLGNCKNCTVCPGDMFEVQKCTPERDSKCARCEKGEFLDQDKKCKPCSKCPSGQHASKLCMDQSDTQCTSEKCPPNTWTDGGVCEICHDCKIGFRLSGDCTSVHDTQCMACPLGQFNDKEGKQTQCQRCNVCDSNYATTSPCQKEKDTVCSPCEANQFVKVTNITTGQSACTPCSTCANGKVYKVCSVTSDTICASGNGYTTNVIMLTFLSMIISFGGMLGFRTYLINYYGSGSHTSSGYINPNMNTGSLF